MCGWMCKIGGKNLLRYFNYVVNYFIGTWYHAYICMDYCVFLNINTLLEWLLCMCIHIHLSTGTFLDSDPDYLACDQEHKLS